MAYELKEGDTEIYFRFGEAELLESFNDNKYADMLMELSNKGKDIHLDFSDVEVVDSLFIGSLIILHKKLQSQSKKITLSNLNEFLSDLFQKLRLGQII